MDLIKSSIKTLDIWNWVNQTFRDKMNQVEQKEFANDAINNNLDLEAPMDEWAKLTKIQVRNR